MVLLSFSLTALCICEVPGLDEQSFCQPIHHDCQSVNKTTELLS